MSERTASLCVRVVAILLALALVLLTAQAPTPIPPYPGDGNPLHDHQPLFCQNHSGAFAQNCDCQAMAEKGDSCKRDEEYGPDSYDEHMNARCSVHCRPKACTCERRCST